MAKAIPDTPQLDPVRGLRQDGSWGATAPPEPDTPQLDPVRGLRLAVGDCVRAAGYSRHTAVGPG